MIGGQGRNLVFVLSTPRAGSTLLAAMLGSHARVLSPPEPWLLLPLATLADRRLLTTAPYDHTFAQNAMAELFSPTLLHGALSAYAVTGYNGLLAESGKQVLVDKTPRYYHILPVLDSLFPDALQVWIKRSPLDTISSCIDTWNLPLSELIGDTVSPYTFDVTISFELLADHFEEPNSNKLIVSYEALVQDAEPDLRAICERLHLTFDGSMLEYGRNRALMQLYRGASMGDKKVLDSLRPHMQSVGRWQGKLNRDEIARILRTLGSEIFTRLGYREQVTEALEYAAIAAADVEPNGRLPELRATYQAYGRADEWQAGDFDRLARPDVQYTLLGHRYAQLERIAQERLSLIQRLDAELRSMRSEGQIRPRTIEMLRDAAADESPEDPPTSTATDDSAHSRQHAEEGGSLQPADAQDFADGKQAAVPVWDLLAEQRAVLERLGRSVQDFRDNYVRALEATHRSQLQALELSLQVQLRELESSRRSAEDVADARLRVIEEQQRAIEAYRRWHPMTRLRGVLAPRIGVLYQHAPRPLHIPEHYVRARTYSPSLRVSIVTPSLNQGVFIERTLRSVLDETYPHLEYVVQDGMSNDDTAIVLDRYSGLLSHVECREDTGFGNAINVGFHRTSGDVMAYLNSDDLLLPGAVHYVANYFERHPQVDVVYGHRVIIDEYDAEIGRWVLPAHDDEVLSWADYVPQETLFWRRSMWEKAGACIDESFRFAIDWDLLLRFREAGARMVRLPRFLGAFRVHPHQKTSTEMQQVGVEEMHRLRERCHGRQVTQTEIQRSLRSYLRRHFFYHKLYRLGVLRY